jgi:hypothetical protein
LRVWRHEGNVTDQRIGGRVYEALAYHGGALVILCDTSKKLIAYMLIDPRAHFNMQSLIAIRIPLSENTQIYWKRINAYGRLED